MLATRMMMSGPSAPQETYTNTLTFNGSGFEAYSVRAIIPASALSVNGTQVRFTCESSSGGSLTVDNMSIVERSGSTANGTAIPSEVLFSASSGFTIPANSTIVSDWLTFTLDATKDYLNVFDFNASNGFAKSLISGSHGQYTKVATNSYNIQTVAGFTFESGRAAIVNKIEVRS
mgnify:CR=1 FL=1